MEAPTIVNIRIADENHRVLSVHGGKGYMHSPCAECPWRMNNAGSFPAEAFRISANTAADASLTKFGCHMSGPENPKTCAGFLLSDTAMDNAGARIMQIEEELHIDPGRCDLFPTYVQMAVANGVDPDDPALKDCVPESKERFFRRI